MVTLRDYLDKGGEQAVFGRTFLLGGILPYVLKVEGFCDHSETGERYIDANLELSGKSMHFKEFGPVEALSNMEEILLFR